MTATEALEATIAAHERHADELRARLVEVCQILAPHLGLNDASWVPAEAPTAARLAASLIVELRSQLSASPVLDGPF